MTKPLSPRLGIPPLLALSFALFVPAAAAQPMTWIVDQNNGPGTNFTDLPPALVAAASGDTILVRPGGYTASTTN